MPDAFVTAGSKDTPGAPLLSLVRRSRTEATPTRLVIFLAVAALPIFWCGYVVVDSELHGPIRLFFGGYTEVNLKSLGNFPLDSVDGTLTDIPARWRALNGKRILLDSGFMYDPKATAGDQVNEFQFVYDLYRPRWGPPQVQERVFVHVPNHGTVKYYDQLVRIEGTLHVNVVKKAGYITSVFTLDLDKLTPN